MVKKINWPWDQIKVGFDCDDIEAFDRWWEILTPRGRKQMLPKGWEWSESYASPCGAFLIFNVEGQPNYADGLRVRGLINRITERAGRRAL